MKKRHIIKVIVVTMFVLFYSFAKEQEEWKVAQNIDLHLVKNVSAFKEALLELNLLEEKGESEEDLKAAFLKTRLAYKRVELFLDYADIKTNKNYNGANIITDKYIVSSTDELNYPHGLQVIEELLFNPDKESRKILKEEISLLNKLISKELENIGTRTIRNPKDNLRIVLDAMRYEIHRIEALGITGFDVPNAESSLPETKAALEGTQEVLKLYSLLFKKNKAEDLYNEGQEYLTNAILYLEVNTDFATFNRLEFIRNYLHPLSKMLTKSTKVLSYKFPVNNKSISSSASHLFAKDIMSQRNPTANEYSIQLGERLFKDTLLSIGNSKSCSSCHQADKAFTDGLVKSFSIHGDDLLLRNTPSLTNVTYQSAFFYDSRVLTLEKQTLTVLHNKLEMGGNISYVLDSLKLNPDYVKLFAAAYENRITEYNTIRAISDYVNSLTSMQSRFDDYLDGEENALTASEINGFNLFTGKAKCATCHFMPLFNGLLPPHYVDTESEILGVPYAKEDVTIIDPDIGKFGATNLEIHRFAFKTPGLRNVELTAPYMHNGVFETLEEVVEFYNNGGGAGQGMFIPSQTLPSDSLHLNNQEIQDLVNFMKALTDNTN